MTPLIGDHAQALLSARLIGGKAATDHGFVGYDARRSIILFSEAC